MRLIITDDQIEVLNNIISWLNETNISCDIKYIWCGEDVNENDLKLPPSHNNWYFAKSRDALLDVIINQIGIREEDRFLFDVSLFPNKEFDEMFANFASVGVYKEIKKREVKGVRTEFFMTPIGYSSIDFAREIGILPFYRPKTVDDGDANIKRFTKKIEEICHV